MAERAGFEPAVPFPTHALSKRVPSATQTPLRESVFIQQEAQAAMSDGGEGGIRTPDALARMPVFETGAFSRSATSPMCRVIARRNSPSVHPQHQSVVAYLSGVGSSRPVRFLRKNCWRRSRASVAPTPFRDLGSVVEARIGEQAPQ